MIALDIHTSQLAVLYRRQHKAVCDYGLFFLKKITLY